MSGDKKNMKGEGKMKRGILVIITALAIVIAVSGITLPSEGRAAEIKLKFSNFYPPTHQYAILGQQLCDEIKQKTNGKVEVSYYPSGILTTATKVYDGVVNSVSDMGLSHVEYTRGRFPVTETLCLPMGYPSGYIAAQVANDFYDKFRPKEWDAVHVLFFFSTGPQIISTTKKPVKRLEDLKGLKIRAAGRPADVVKNLGGTPVPVEMAEIYDSLQRGVVDGLLSSMEVQKGWKTGELIKYATLSWPVGTTFTYYVIMNKAKWEKLPEDVKKVLNEVASQFKDKYAVASNAIDIEGRDYLKKFGGQLIPLSKEEVNRWVSAAAPTIEKHTNELEGKNYTKGDIKAYVNFIKERTTYWTKKEKELKIPTPY